MKVIGFVCLWQNFLLNLYSGRAMIQTRIGGCIMHSFSAVLTICSWEPAENVQQCNRLLASFWKHVGTDDEDYPIGYEVEADASWISPSFVALSSGYC